MGDCFSSQEKEKKKGKERGKKRLKCINNVKNYCWVMLSGAALKANSKGSIPKRRNVTKLWPDSKRRGHRLRPNRKRHGGKVAKWCVRGARTRTKGVFGKRESLSGASPDSALLRTVVSDRRKGSD